MALGQNSVVSSGSGDNALFDDLQTQEGRSKHRDALKSAFEEGRHMRSVGQFKKRRETFLRTFVDSDPQVSKSQEELTWLGSGQTTLRVQRSSCGPESFEAQCTYPSHAVKTKGDFELRFTDETVKVDIQASDVEGAKSNT